MLGSNEEIFAYHTLHLPEKFAVGTFMCAQIPLRKGLQAIDHCFLIGALNTRYILVHYYFLLNVLHLNFLNVFVVYKMSGEMGSYRSKPFLADNRSPA